MHPFLVLNKKFIADNPADLSVKRLMEFLEKEKHLYSSEAEPNLVGGRRGMAWEITEAERDVKQLCHGKVVVSFEVYNQAKKRIAEAHGRINERITLMETFENLFNDGEEILKETPGYTSIEKTDLLKALQEPTQRVRNEVKLEQIIADVEARKKMVDSLRRKKKEKVAYTKSPIHGVTRALSNGIHDMFHELGKNDRHEVPLASARRGEALGWTTTRQARRYA